MTGRGLARDSGIIHVERHDDLHSAPAATGNGCCYGAAFTGGEKCSCWEPVLDVQPAPHQEGPMNAARRACHDCAYRAGSPEREAAGGDLPDYNRDRPFACHQGMPRVIAITHPIGETRPLTEDSYAPDQEGGRVWLADGRPADYCAGWAAVTRIRDTSERTTA